MRWTVRGLAAMTVLLALMCVGLAVTFHAKAEESACFREALADGETPAVADSDCLARPFESVVRR